MAEKFFYMRGQASLDLQTFTKSLFAILTGSAPSLKWRADETQDWYIKYQKASGQERISAIIASRMLGHTMALLENDFPYDEIMPFGGYENHSGSGLMHYCLFSRDYGLLIPENIDQVVNVNFADLPTLIFMHDDSHTSIKDIKHAHIIVDLGREKARLKQRYFDSKDFSE